MGKKLTITDLLKMKGQKAKTKKKSVLIERLGAEIVIEAPSRELCLEAIEMSQDPNLSDKADEFLVYSIVKEPNLKDPVLLKEYDVVEPTEIVREIFEIGEIAELAGLALDLGGFKKGMIKVVEEVKN